MIKNIVILLSLVTLFPYAVSAQRKGKNVKAKRPAAVAMSPGQKIFKSMLSSTAKVMFIDSVVVEKDNFLSMLPLNSESGHLSIANPKEDLVNQMAVYQNDFGDRRIIAKGDSSNSALYTQTMLGNKWSKAASMSGIDNSLYKLQNYPFLAADGVTLFFSAEGEESMGGRDIFMSTFDSDNSEWYKPQNYGLPFNSTDNDYLLAIDDVDTLGWLVTDRHQPEGKVCIYTFVPTEVRQNFDDDDLDDSELTSFARIVSIKDTWQFGNRNAALARRDKMLKRLNEKNVQDNAIWFAIDDKTVITSPQQFKSDESRKLYKQTEELRKMIKQTETELDNYRKSYHEGNHSLSDKILKAEKEQEQQQTDLYSLEKRIRNIERGN